MACMGFLFNRFICLLSSAISSFYCPASVRLLHSSDPHGGDHNARIQTLPAARIPAPPRWNLSRGPRAIRERDGESRVMTTRGTRHAWDASRRVRKGVVRGQAKGIRVLNSTNRRGRLLLKQTMLPPKRRLKMIWREYNNKSCPP
jgi:hypothetical protein